MEHRNKRTDHTHRKTVEIRFKDRGDQFKRNIKDNAHEKKKATEDGGDLTETVLSLDKNIKIEECRNDRHTRRGVNINTAVNKERNTPANDYQYKNGESNKVQKETAEYDWRKMIRNKYTVQIKRSHINVNKAAENEKNEQPIKQLKAMSKSKDSDASGKSEKSTNKISQATDAKEKSRKPIIRTITARNETTTYKSVAFVDQKRRPTPLQIKLPTYINKLQENPQHTAAKNVTGHTATNTLPKRKINSVTSKVSIREKHSRKRKEKMKIKQTFKLNARQMSPELRLRQNSPLTEVAKWAPSCITGHTKPYYEAWVDTTLTAISRDQNRAKLYLDKEMRTLQRAYDRLPSPEFIRENLMDERYTGRIKVKHR